MLVACDIKQVVYTEFLKAGDNGDTHPQQFSLVCAKFWLLNTKLTINYTFYLIVTVFVKKKKKYASFDIFPHFLAQFFFKCIFDPAKQIGLRKSGFIMPYRSRSVLLYSISGVHQITEFLSSLQALEIFCNFTEDIFN